MVHCGELATYLFPRGLSMPCVTPSGKNLACKQIAWGSVRSIFGWLRTDQYELMNENKIL